MNGHEQAVTSEGPEAANGTVRAHMDVGPERMTSLLCLSNACLQNFIQLNQSLSHAPRPGAEIDLLRTQSE
jgi:hypothetical protein